MDIPRRVDISPDKRLKAQLLTLSRSLPLCLVEKMATELFHTRTITGHEVEVIASQRTDREKASQLIQIVLRKGRKASEIFYQCLRGCCPDLQLMGTATSLDPVYEQSISKTNRINKQPVKDTSIVMPGDYRSIPTSDCHCTKRDFTPYAPSYVINIHNSVLCHCVIGDNSSQVISTERDQLLHQRQYGGLQDVRNNLIDGQQGASEVSAGEPHIQVQNSHMEYVIIGDHSSMVVTTSESEEEEEGEREEHEECPQECPQECHDDSST
ncbi:uncharacterized protein si:dkey-29h14.10 [Engraulis encrasicolus]|uniref:uncharacterized protein si:dkey-29h14.10 n=1 Tax=Engraulis encrasicolus TaxID=184585 RepID=UPI002FD2A099